MASNGIRTHAVHEERNGNELTAEVDSSPSLNDTNGKQDGNDVETKGVKANGNTSKNDRDSQPHDIRDSSHNMAHTNSDNTLKPKAHGPEADASFRSGQHAFSGDDGEGEEEEEDGSEEDDEDEEDEEGMEDEEPVLKYERPGGSTHELLERDSASSLVVSSKLFVSNHFPDACWDEF